MGNERIRSQLRVVGLTPLDVATQLEIDPRTVERWIATGRVPRQPIRGRAASVLKAEETYLWPELLDDTRTHAASASELVTLYPTRAAVPEDVWQRLFANVGREFDLLVYAGLFLADRFPELPKMLVSKGRSGMTSRLLYGDPDADCVANRGDEEGIGGGLAARIRLTLTYMAPVLGEGGIETRTHCSVLYNSVFRFDDEMLVNTHVLGSPAAHNPVLHLRKVDGGRLFNHYLDSFERVWTEARPLDGCVGA